MSNSSGSNGNAMQGWLQREKRGLFGSSSKRRFFSAIVDNNTTAAVRLVRLERYASCRGDKGQSLKRVIYVHIRDDQRVAITPTGLSFTVPTARGERHALVAASPAERDAWVAFFSGK